MGMPLETIDAGEYHVNCREEKANPIHRGGGTMEGTSEPASLPLVQVDEGSCRFSFSLPPVCVILALHGGGRELPANRRLCSGSVLGGSRRARNRGVRG